MIYSITVLGAPFSSQSPLTALHFANAILNKGHEIFRIFFYEDGVHNGSDLIVAPQDDAMLPEGWKALKHSHNIELFVCIGAGLKRGVFNETEAQRYDRQAHSLGESFLLSGLGQWVEACIKSDKMVTFGT